MTANQTPPADIDGDYVALPSGATFLRIAGQGTAPLVVVHGGPGMEQQYLVEGLGALEPHFRVYFYDQVGAGRDKRPASEASVGTLQSQLLEVLRYVAEREGGPAALLGHSWGCLLIMLTAPWHDDLANGPIYLVSPMGLTWQRCVEAVSRFTARVPSDQVGRIEELESDGSREAGVAEMNLLMPYYVAPGNPTEGIAFLDYSAAINSRVMGEIEGYDVRSVVENLPHPTIVIQGDRDLYQLSDIQELAATADIRTVQNCGHFPFFEVPLAFEEALAAPDQHK